MSVPVPTLEEKIRFINEIALQSFNPLLCSDSTPKGRLTWMEQRASVLQWPTRPLFVELYGLYGIIDFEELKDEKKQLQDVMVELLRQQPSQAVAPAGWISQLFVGLRSLLYSDVPVRSNPVPAKIDFSLIHKDLLKNLKHFVMNRPIDVNTMIGVDEAAKDALKIINENIKKESRPDDRKSFILMSRCSRGGKSTVCVHLHALLQKDNKHVMSISFNGLTDFKRLHREGEYIESLEHALFRSITNQLVDIGEDVLREIDWNGLDDYIGSLPFVLIIDEINCLCDPVRSEVIRIINKYFLNKRNRYVVMTTHQPYLAEKTDNRLRLWSNSVSDASVPVEIFLKMPISRDIVKLQRMDPNQRCNTINIHKAAYYGFMPSLMYAALVFDTESPQKKFDNAVGHYVATSEEFLTFCQALVSGISSEAIKHFNQFSSEVYYDEQNYLRTSWPLCYIECIMNRYKGLEQVADDIVKLIQHLNLSTDTTNSGMAWELSVKVATLIRFVLVARLQHHAVPFDLCDVSEIRGANVELVTIPGHLNSLEAFVKYLDDEKITRNAKSVILFENGSATFKTYDGFCCFYDDGELKSFCGIQCKDNSNVPNEQVNELLNAGGHLIRSDPPQKPRAKRNWRSYNPEATDELLGISLKIMRAK